MFRHFALMDAAVSPPRALHFFASAVLLVSQIAERTISGLHSKFR